MVPNYIPVVVGEFELIGVEMSGEGNDPSTLVEYENVVFAFKMTSAKMLIGTAKEMGLQYMGGAKKLLWIGLCNLVTSASSKLPKVACHSPSISRRQQKAANAECGAGSGAGCTGH